MHFTQHRERFLKDQNKQTGYCLIGREIQLIKEMNWFEKKPDGTLGAIQGQKDDLVDSHAGVFLYRNRKNAYASNNRSEKRSNKTAPAKRSKFLVCRLKII